MLLFVLTGLIYSCEKELQDADAIIEKSIEVSGGTLLDNSNIEFDFRDKHYKATRNNGEFNYQRAFSDSLGEIKDVLNNKGFQRYINNTIFEVSEGKAQAYAGSVNSVHYFSVLPYGLNGTAVNKSYIGKVEIKSNGYHKIKVTFNQEGGGEDYDDVFIYWINTETFKADYLAYSYEENHGLGLRFREAYNERFIEGIRFVDYNNYKPKGNDAVLENLDLKFKNDELELLSKIELKHVVVTL